MESQQKIKEHVEQENRTLQSQILQTEQKLHQQMQVRMNKSLNLDNEKLKLYKTVFI